MERRKFLRQSSLAVSGSLFMPYFLKSFELNAALNSQMNGKSVVLIQLSGGNDGLNTIIPYADDNYYKLRPVIGIKANEVIKLNDQQALNPAMSALQKVYDNGDMAILNDVGYPDPDRSHFRSMDIWHTASNSNEFLQTGWLGRLLDNTANACFYDVLEIEDQLSLAVKGEEKKALSFRNPENFYNLTREPFFKQTLAASHDHDAEHNLGYLYLTMAETYSSAQYIREKSKTYQSKATYPASSFSNNLRTIASLIISGLSTKVYYVSLNGFDTHVRQNGVQEKNLKIYAEGVAAFIEDLKSNNRFNDVVIMTFSEFGRRVAQNAGNGTDHGTASCMMLYSGSLRKKGILNAAPDLTNLDQGDLIHKVDFRNVYATLLENWLQADAQKILTRKFEKLNFI